MVSKIRTLFPYLKFVWAALILYLTLAPGDGEPLFEFLDWPWLDKAGHFVMFFVWSILQFPGAFFREPTLDPFLKKALLVATNSLVLGLLIEAVQMYIPGRSADLMDLAADLAGMAIALLVAKILRSQKTGLN